MKIFKGFEIDKPVSYQDIAYNRCYKIHADRTGCSHYIGKDCVKLYTSNKDNNSVLLVSHDNDAFCHVIDSDFAIRNFTFMKSDHNFTMG